MTMPRPGRRDDVYRRLSPAPGRSRTPGPLAVLVRCRFEVAFVAVVVGLWRLAGGVALGLVALVVVVAAAAAPAVRLSLGSAVRTVVVVHRVRAGLVQAGVGDRCGRPPWLPWARPTGAKGVVVGVWLRAGTTPHDLRAAAHVVAAACGAAAVEVEQPGGRDDRAELHIVRPRWGCPGR